MNEPMPSGVFSGAVDDKGRLRLPRNIRDALGVGEDWFLCAGSNESEIHLRNEGEAGQRVDVDPDGRILIDPSMSDPFKYRIVHMCWKDDRLVISTEPLVDIELLRQFFEP